MADRIVLIGMMGSGKTTVGRLLAETIGWPYHDNDEFVARLFGATPRDILARSGEEELRLAELAALSAALEEPAPCVVSVPAGVILAEHARRTLRRVGHVVWLRGSAETLSARAVGGLHRPWLDGDAAAWFTTAIAARDPLYESVATLVVDVDGRSPPQIVDVIVEALALAKT